MGIPHRVCTEISQKRIYGQIKKDIGEILRKLCNEKKVEIIEAEAWPGSHPHAGEYTTVFKYSTTYMKEDVDPFTGAKNQ